MAQHRIRAVARPPEPFASIVKTPAPQRHRLGRTLGPPNTEITCKGRGFGPARPLSGSSRCPACRPRAYFFAAGSLSSTTSTLTSVGPGLLPLWVVAGDHVTSPALLTDSVAFPSGPVTNSLPPVRL